ncbi:hypothetical protein L9F63_020050, partial [Diploptera punctata]
MAKTKEKKAKTGKKSSEEKQSSREKSKSKRTSESKENNAELTWQEKLIQYPLNEDDFVCSVVMFVQAEPQYEDYLQHFSEICDPGKRRCIDVVSMKQIKAHFDVKE